MLPGLINPSRLTGGIPKPPEAPNLARTVSADEITRPRGFFLALALDAAVILAALASGYLYRGYLAGHRTLALAILVLAIFAALSVFEMLLQRNPVRRAAVLGLEIAALLAFFYDQPPAFLFAVGGVGFFFLIWGEMQSYAEMRNALEIKFFRIVRPALNKLLTAVALMAVLLYLPQWEAERSFFSPEDWNGVFGSAARVGNQFYRELNFTSTFDEFAESFIRLQFTTNPTFNQLLPAAKDKAVEEAKSKFLNDLQSSWNVNISPDEPLSSVVYEYAVRQLERWQTEFGDRFLSVWAIAAFFIVRSFGFFLYAAVSAATYAVFQLLLALNVMRISGESRMKEVLEYN